MPVNAPQLSIVRYPASVLRRRAEPVSAPADEVREVALRMIELMREANGVGLAAPQVGLSWRLFVANPSGAAGDDTVFVDPQITDASRDADTFEEGCLSLPEIRGQITRPRQVTITATDLEGNRFSMTSDELPARVWQHEYDHLDGVLILDKMTRLDKLANRKLVKELEREARG